MAVEAVALQRAEAEVRRQAALPRAAFELEYVSGVVWVLRNVGSASAENVTVDKAGLESVLSHEPNGVKLLPHAGHELMLADDNKNPVPAQLMVKWDGQEEPAVVPVPPKI